MWRLASKGETAGLPGLVGWKDCCTPKLRLPMSRCELAAVLLASKRWLMASRSEGSLWLLCRDAEGCC